jgi:hypothetical protein
LTFEIEGGGGIALCGCAFNSGAIEYLVVAVVAGMVLLAGPVAAVLLFRQTVCDNFGVLLVMNRVT